MRVFLKILIFFVYCNPARATDYEFSMETFQLGRWSPKSLSYEQGLSKIESLDKWWGSLTPDQKNEFATAYTLNRNRLFLVTQEKRLKAEIDQPIDPLELARDQIQPSWIAAGRNVLYQDREKMYSDLLTLNRTALSETAALSGKRLQSLEDISKIGLKNSGGVNLAPSFSKSVSKSGGSSSGLRAQTMAPMWSSSDTKCKRDDKACLRSQERLLDEKPQPLFVDPAFLERARSKLGLFEPVCKEFVGSRGPLAESPEFETFRKKRDNFLKNIGSQNWKPNKSENDLSRWYSEPMTQWVNGRSTNRCVGHAISSDIAATANRGSILNYAISPEQTYGQVQVITREELEAKKAQGPLRPEDEAVLGFLTEEGVKTIDRKHVSFCNSKFYADPQVDDGSGRKVPLGAVYLENSLNHIFSAFQKKPLCGGREATSNIRQGDVPLFTVDNFASMEFDSAAEQSLDFDFFRMLIDTGNPPIVSIDSVDRIESGEWIHIKPSRENMTHVLNVVGYGEEVDPVTLCKTRYLKLRDSLGEKKIHYKVPANNFLSHVTGLYKVTSIRKSD